MDYLLTVFGQLTTSSTIRNANIDWFLFLAPIVYFSIGLIIALFGVVFIGLSIYYGMYAIIAKFYQTKH